MIISDKHKYLFIETPHTGSTAVSKELIKNYGGEEVLYKHANYHEFLKQAAPEQKKYLVFAGIRNPLDEAISLYNKFLNDHKSNYTDENKLIENGGWVSKRKVEIYQLVQETESFEEFIREFYKGVYTSNININKKYCNYIMRFEKLDEDLSKVFDRIGIKKKRPLPVINKTAKRGTFENYYTDNAISHAEDIFAPFMKEWGYDYPREWSSSRYRLNNATYAVRKVGRSLYSRQIKGGYLKNATLLRTRLE